MCAYNKQVYLITAVQFTSLYCSPEIKNQIMNQIFALQPSVQQHKPVYNAASKSNLHMSGAMRISGQIYAKQRWIF